MDVERRSMDYHANLTTLDINVLCGYSNPDKIALPLVAPVKGDAGEIFSLNSDRTGRLIQDPRAVDRIIFGRGVRGPEVTTNAYVLTRLLGDREFWVTRYDWENKIWLRKTRE